MKWWCLLALTGCLDVVEHGIAVGLTVRTTDCDGVSVLGGVTQLRFTARSGEAVLWSRTVPVGSIPRALGLPGSPDVQLRVEALDASGHVVARGSSAHFAVAVSPPGQATVELAPVERFSRVCATLGTARAFHTATVLRDGRVLIVGGQGSAGEALSSMELLSPSEVRDLGPLALTVNGSVYRLPRARHAAILGITGQVMISGGEAPPSTSLASVLFIDPETDFAIGALGPQQPRNLPRSRHAAFGVGTRVFLVGGSTTEVGQVPNPKVERVDLTTGVIQPVSDLAVPRFEAALAQLGSVAIVAGGLEGGAASPRVELVALDSPGPPARLTLTTARTGAAAVTVGERVLIAGGTNGAPLASTEWIRVSPPTIEPGPAITPRAGLCATPLSGGSALLVGGLDANGPSSAAELIDADGNRVQLAFPGPARHGHTCLGLDDGSALVIGGLDAAGRPLNDVWRYTPAG